MQTTNDFRFMITEEYEGKRGVTRVSGGLNSNLCEHCIYYIERMIGKIGSLFKIKGLRRDQMAAVHCVKPIWGTSW